MDDLIAFVTARLDEDELAAKIAAVDGAWGQRGTIPPEPGPLNRNHRLMEAFNPARVLREVAADRGLLRLYEQAAEVMDPDIVNWTRGIIQDRAGIWSDHPDYRQEWKP